jgi:hypothetical protein
MTATPLVLSDAEGNLPTVQLTLSCAVDLNANPEIPELTYLLVLPMPLGFEPARELNVAPDAGGTVRWEGLRFTTIGGNLQISHELNDPDALLIFDFVLGKELQQLRRDFTDKALEVARHHDGRHLAHLHVTASVLYGTGLLARLIRITTGQWRQTDWLIVETP